MENEKPMLNKKHVVLKVVLGVIFAVVVVFVGGMYIAANPQVLPGHGVLKYGEPIESDLSEYYDVRETLNIARGERLETYVNFDPTTLESHKKVLETGMDVEEPYLKEGAGFFDDLLTVYADNTFTGEVGVNYRAEKSGEGYKVIVSSDQHFNTEMWGKVDKTWDMFSDYYLVQKLDTDGSKLQKPIVQPFHIKDEPKVKQPQANVILSEYGCLDVSWGDVEGATGYYVQVVLENPDRGGLYEGVVQLKSPSSGNYVDISSGTSDPLLNNSQTKKYSTCAGDHADAKGVVTTQNTELSLLMMSAKSGINANNYNDTNLYKSGGDAINTGIKGFVVSAHDDLGNISTGSYVDLQNQFNITPYTPNSDALTTYISQKGLNHVSSNGGTTLYADQLCQNLSPQDFPYQIPVTMVNGEVHIMPIKYDVTEAAVFREVVGTPDPSMDRYNSIIIRGQVAGTKATVDIQTEGYKNGDWGSPEQCATLAAGMKAISDSGTGGTGATTETYKFASLNSSDAQNAITEMPEIDLPVNGPTPLVKFVAANIIAGNQYIDIKNYVGDCDIHDAKGLCYLDNILDVVYAQNPLIPWKEISSVLRDSSGTKVGFVYKNPEHYKQWQNELIAAARDAATQIFHDGQTDLEKVTAISNYIDQKTQYNTEIYEKDLKNDAGFGDFMDADWIEANGYIFDAYGSLVKGSSVCAGYAKAFNLLADLGGLEAVYVTGPVVGAGPHAWNKVKIDGSWKVVDTTWNDDQPTPLYLGVTDYDVSTPNVIPNNPGRLQEDKTWMFPQLVSQFDAR